MAAEFGPIVGDSQKRGNRHDLSLKVRMAYLWSQKLMVRALPFFGCWIHWVLGLQLIQHTRRQLLVYQRIGKLTDISRASVATGRVFPAAHTVQLFIKCIRESLRP